MTLICSSIIWQMLSFKNILWKEGRSSEYNLSCARTDQCHHRALMLWWILVLNLPCKQTMLHPAFFQECNNPCCNANNCSLKLGAECAHGSCCHECKVGLLDFLCMHLHSGVCRSGLWSQGCKLQDRADIGIIQFFCITGACEKQFLI